MPAVAKAMAGTRYAKGLPAEALAKAGRGEGLPPPPRSR